MLIGATEGLLMAEWLRAGLSGKLDGQDRGKIVYSLYLYFKTVFRRIQITPERKLIMEYKRCIHDIEPH